MKRISRGKIWEHAESYRAREDGVEPGWSEQKRSGESGRRCELARRAVIEVEIHKMRVEQAVRHGSGAPPGHRRNSPQVA
jgi:hypothetical protein